MARLRVVRRLFVPSALAASILLAGCNSKSKPTPENFLKGLNDHFAQHSDCLFPTAPRFPYETSDKQEIRQMDSLVKAQLLKVSQEAAIHVSRYTVSDVGARYAPRFCYGHREATSIVSSTPPKQENGFPETHVVYRYHIAEVPVWAKTPEVLAAFPKMAQAISSEQTGNAVLAGTMVGWQVPD